MMKTNNDEIIYKVEWFASLMEMKLKQNAHKNGWQECSLLWLIAKLNEEVGELAQIVVREIYSPDGNYIASGDSNSNQVLGYALFETADIANLALMIGDLLANGTAGGRKLDNEQ